MASDLGLSTFPRQFLGVAYTLYREGSKATRRGKATGAGPPGTPNAVGFGMRSGGRPRCIENALSLPSAFPSGEFCHPPLSGLRARSRPRCGSRVPGLVPRSFRRSAGLLESSCCASYSHQSASDQKLWLLVNPRETLRETKVKTGRLSTKLWVPRMGRCDPGAQDAEPRCSPRTQGRGTRGQSGVPRGSGERARAECRWPRGARDHG